MQRWVLVRLHGTWNTLALAVIISRKKKESRKIIPFRENLLFQFIRLHLSLLLPPLQHAAGGPLSAAANLILPDLSVPIITFTLFSVQRSR